MGKKNCEPWGNNRDIMKCLINLYPFQNGEQIPKLYVNVVQAIFKKIVFFIEWREHYNMGPKLVWNVTKKQWDADTIIFSSCANWSCFSCTCCCVKTFHDTKSSFYLALFQTKPFFLLLPHTNQSIQCFFLYTQHHFWNLVREQERFSLIPQSQLIFLFVFWKKARRSLRVSWIFFLKWNIM